MERPIHSKFIIKVYMPTLNNTAKNYSHRFTGSGTSHTSKIGILGSRAHRTPDTHEI